MGKYLVGKMFWDPDYDVNALKEEWINLYYGPAGDKINELVKRYEEIWFARADADDTFSKNYTSMAETLANYAAPLMLGLQKLCEEGITQIRNSALSDAEKSAFVKRVEAVKFTFMFQELENYEIYHHTSVYGRYDLAVKVFDLAEKLGIDKYAEGTKIDNLRSKYL